MNEIKNLIRNHSFSSIVDNFSVDTIVEILDFEQAMVLSKKLLENDQFDFILQEYAIRLIEKIKQSFPKKWSRDWRHEAYLGYAYSLLGCDIEKEFDAYSNAAELSENPPIEIQMHMALLWSYPGLYKVKMDEETAISILEGVANKIPYMEAVGGLIRLYEETQQYERSAYWSTVLAKSESENLYDKHNYLNFFDDYA